MSASPKKGPPTPSLSTASLTGNFSVRSNAHAPPSTIRTVITAPPWAQDEPPSPTEPHDPDRPRPVVDLRSSDVTSSRSSVALGQAGPSTHSHWWAFARPHADVGEAYPFEGSGAGSFNPDKKAVSFKERSPWLMSGTRRSPQDLAKDRAFREQNSNLYLDLPRPDPFTVSQSKTPGWDIPWQSKEMSALTHGDNHSRGAQSALSRPDDTVSHKSRSRKKRFRAFLLSNIYVPLLFRFVNITFTTAALAIAIRIRQLEMRYHVMGVVGSSVTLVIIFAPLTLVHVMVAIYLEYFSRPLGLWRTSAKLAHTLLEVCFICAWSAALSLCFDNFFTSLIPCASISDTSWYNQLARPSLNLPSLGRGEGGVGDTICDDQLVLICLVGVGLIMYCINLVISLFRIFEKVKNYAHGRSEL
ncbi:hypothetical protein CONPUDRAFT_134006 [Coniophora puteana RWD-64-598 SS2]|uniref:Uncharacterized protein n=1 Tax=Coniophora puteana (strain RWD-64-598) TaxID=741705 RepID=A0A5M3N5M2_CONPW|nr:uncharacterized protein CONPUDRAFT_134006 [Coniophora puteana RWD-64-598 SS2]EIW86608.1 hypothetical protein CONPUDRAFT_134006 [Coniophora puteana RWD-64-598 SS2]